MAEKTVTAFAGCYEGIRFIIESSRNMKPWHTHKVVMLIKDGVPYSVELQDRNGNKMTDTLLERIKAVEIGVDAQYIEAMQDRIIADAEIIKAAVEMAEATHGAAFSKARSAFRAAMEARG